MKNLENSALFQGMPPDTIQQIINEHFKKEVYKAGDLILSKGQRYQQLIIIEQGTVQGEMVNSNGERVIIEEISAPHIIAPAILFATDNHLPVDVIALTNCKLHRITLGNFTSLLQQHTTMLMHFLQAISDRSKFLSDRIRLLRFGTIKSKLSEFLLEQMLKQQKSTFIIPISQQELAHQFGVTRPALSRAIAMLQHEGAIQWKNKEYTIINASLLESYTCS